METGQEGLIELDADHPGFRDRVYRERRMEIARLAREHSQGTPVPRAPYTREEHEVWTRIWRELGPLHDAHGCAEIVALERGLGLRDRDRIPQLTELSELLAQTTGFRMEPVAGLVAARRFLIALGHGVFSSTQYIRHASRPFFTPEPDVVHELVGHAASLAHPGIASVSRAFGGAAQVASEADMSRLDRVYWYTLEFGVARSPRGVEAVGAGLLSSVEEIARIEHGPQLLDWDLERMAARPYDPTAHQEALFVAPSFEVMLADLEEWLTDAGWRAAH